MLKSGNAITGIAWRLLAMRITDRERREQGGVITIPGALLSNARVIFESWK